MEYAFRNKFFRPEYHRGEQSFTKDTGRDESGMDTDTREKMEAYRHVYETGTTAVLSSALFRGIWSAPEDAVALRYPAARHGDHNKRITKGEIGQ